MALPSPPKSYGGLERVVYDYAWGLRDLGHDVTLVAAKGSQAPQGVELVETVASWDTLTHEMQKKYSEEDGVVREWNGLKWFGHTWNGWRRHEESAFQIYREALPAFDVVCDHSWAKWSYSSNKQEIIGTTHSQKPYNVKPPRPYPCLTAVSNGHANFLSSQLGIPVRTLLNPVNVSEYELVKDKSDRVLSFTRIMATKGVHHFLNLCETQHVLGDVAGDDSTLVPDQGYVEMVKRKCQGSPYLTYHGLVDDAKRKKLLSEAKCLICYKDMGYEEVFGLNVVEAAAAGTPTIALRSWGFEDIIIHGKTGFIADTLEDVPKFLTKIKEINPEDCRARAKHFSRYNRTQAYVKIMESVVKGSRW